MAEWNTNGWETNPAEGNSGFATKPDMGGSNGFDNGFANDNHDDFGNGGNDGACFNCGQSGHNKSDCPNPRVFTGTCNVCGKEGHMRKDCPDRPPAPEGPMKCFRCEEEGHTSRDCPQPLVCKECGNEGHFVKDCPDKVCKNCGEKGHSIAQCEAARLVDRSSFPDTTTEKAWEMIEQAVAEREVDDLKFAVQTYVKSSPDTTYVDLEKAFRSQGVGAYFIAMERPSLSMTLTNMDLQGHLGKTFTVNYRLESKPARPRERELWPSSPEENYERLADAGEIVARGIPKCQNCSEMGHISKSCPQERLKEPTATIKCYNCDEEGHRVRDCPNPRKNKFACKNCGQEGHKVAECTEPPNLENMECRKCNEKGHMARDCPQGGGRGCRNCGQEGHMSKECTEPRNMALVQCRNCDEFGHTGKECPKPRDISRVTCSNCQEKGHFKSKCTNPIKVEDDGGFGANDDAGLANSSGGLENAGFANSSGGFDNNAGFANASGGFDNNAGFANTSGGFDNNAGSGNRNGGFETVAAASFNTTSW